MTPNQEEHPYTNRSPAATQRPVGFVIRFHIKTAWGGSWFWVFNPSCYRLLRNCSDEQKPSSFVPGLVIYMWSCVSTAFGWTNFPLPVA